MSEDTHKAFYPPELTAEMENHAKEFPLGDGDRSWYPALFVLVGNRAAYWAEAGMVMIRVIKATWGRGYYTENMITKLREAAEGSVEAGLKDDIDADATSGLLPFAGKEFEWWWSEMDEGLRYLFVSDEKSKEQP